MTDHEYFMNEALKEAKEAARCGEVPVGCVIVKDGEIIARGRNRREERQSVIGHAEILAIEAACAHLGRWRLLDCALYVTLEPCPMCAGAIINARIPKIVFGARDPAMGACGSVINLFEEQFHHKPAIFAGILKHECEKEMSVFFENLRNESGKM